MKHTDISKVKAGDLWVWEKTSVIIGVTNSTIDIYDPELAQERAEFHSDQVLDNTGLRIEKCDYDDAIRRYGYYFVS